MRGGTATRSVEICATHDVHLTRNRSETKPRRTRPAVVEVQDQSARDLFNFYLIKLRLLP